MGWNGVPAGESVRDPGGMASRDDTPDRLAPTFQATAKENTVLKKARSRASLIVASSVGLYRELAVSAFSLVRR